MQTRLSTLAWLLILGSCGQPVISEKPAGTSTAGALPVNSESWHFDDAQAGSLPSGWRIEATNAAGPLAAWQLETDETAPSGGQVLALHDCKDNADQTYNLCWIDSVSFLDGEIEVKVKSGGTGIEDQGGGPIWRARDANNYYIARWNPLEDNFRIYFVKEGRRQQIATADFLVAPDAWHTLRIVVQGSKIQGYLDDKLWLEVEDETFPEAGAVGVWTKADAETRFDDFRVVYVEQ